MSIVVVVVRIYCIYQLSRDEVTRLTYSSYLRVNVCVSVYFVQVQVKLALERFHRSVQCLLANCSMGSCVLGSLSIVRSRES